MKRRMTDTEITSDGITVWVFSHGATIGRFGRNGIDVHNDDPKCGTECLYCTHTPVTATDWETFKSQMLLHHKVSITDEYKPLRFRTP